MQLNDVFQDWLSASKISEKVQEEFEISFDENIIIPVHDHDGTILYNKYRRSPLSEEKPKYWYDIGGRIELYAWHKAKDHKEILITEGEKDCLVAWSNNIPAVTSTGGAQSFQEDWVELFKDKDVTICLDNDPAGAEGTVRILDLLPNAKVLFIPDMPNVKDISDYVARGGNLHDLIGHSRGFKGIEEVKEDMIKRIAIFQSTYFHQAYIKRHTKVVPKNVKRPSFSNDALTNAKLYPITNMLEFRQNKMCCPFHNEKTPSFNYYPKTNTCYCFGCGKVADSIEIYQLLHKCSFSEAVKELNKLV